MHITCLLCFKELLALNELDTQHYLKFDGRPTHILKLSKQLLSTTFCIIGETFVTARNISVSWASQMTKLVLHDVNFSVFKVIVLH